MARIDMKRLTAVASVVRNESSTAKPMNFYSYPGGQRASDEYPDIGDSGVLNFFFFTILHQFGFWYGDEKGYVGPLYGKVNGRPGVKGANLLFMISLRAFTEDPSLFFPERLATIAPDELFRKVFVDDNGPVPFPDLEARLTITHEYGRWFVENGVTPDQVLIRANLYENPLRLFLDEMREVGGYNHDPIHKRQALLAMVLANRPEQFLRVNGEGEWPPVIDYHVMRVLLRLGVVVPSRSEYEVLSLRRWVSKQTEQKIRNLAFRAVNTTSMVSAVPNPTLDHLLWSARRYCPEMEPPTCSKCIFNDVCAKRVELFQPVFRTTDY